jgi:hypothetical protein
MAQGATNACFHDDTTCAGNTNMAKHIVGSATVIMFFKYKGRY